MAAQQSMGMQPGPQYGNQGYPPQQGNQGGLVLFCSAFISHFQSTL
jgi:hypothetical protein